MVVHLSLIVHHRPVELVLTDHILDLVLNEQLLLLQVLLLHQVLLKLLMSKSLLKILLTRLRLWGQNRLRLAIYRLFVYRLLRLGLCLVNI